jgi:hypothetical protein
MPYDFLGAFAPWRAIVCFDHRRKPGITRRREGAKEGPAKRMEQ